MKRKKNFTLKTLLRSIRGSLGRYFAILAIVALGVGFFTGLRNAQPSMQQTADRYYDEQLMYDFQLVSTLGLTAGDLAALAGMEGVSAAEGGYRTEALIRLADGEEAAFLLLSLPSQVALPRLTGGRMPENDSECLADSKAFGEEDLGKTLTLDGGDTADCLSGQSYTIVGLVQSPRYLSLDRGSTALGSGSLEGFLYLPVGAFDSEVYHEALLRFDLPGMAFSDTYEDAVAEIKPAVEALLRERAGLRYEELRADAEQELADARAELEEARELYGQMQAAGAPQATLEALQQAIAEGEALLAQGESQLAALTAPVTYVLGPDSNAGYASFGNDIAVVNGIADVFPVFFVIIAALVCITTMTRMVNEERTQIGTLKALGYGDAAISAKYLLYAVSSALMGCVIGYFLGTGVIPQVVWTVYRINYDFAPLDYHFSTVIHGGCLARAAAGSVAATLFACRAELAGRPAELIRPKAPAAGKRILLERLTPVWRRFSFLNKVTVRNAFRYKKRVCMMLLGIGGCTALIVTGFGLKDSVANILDYQYDEIQTYDLSVSFEAGEETQAALSQALQGKDGQHVFGYMDSVRAEAGENAHEAYAVALPPGEAADYFDLHDGGDAIAYPGAGEAVLSAKLAELLELKVGDSVTLPLPGGTVTVTVSGICDNYVNHYVYLSADSLPEASNTAFVRTGEQTDAGALAAELRGVAGVSYVTVVSEERAMMETSMASMNYIVLVALLCAGVLAFIVLCNLTNINIMERIREVATVKVLGFYPRETASYVLRENLFLAVTGGLLGLGLGKLLHWYVMAQIHVDAMAFDERITVWSYLISFGMTVAFAVLANLFMRIRLDRVPMAESLKSVE